MEKKSKVKNSTVSILLSLLMGVISIIPPLLLIKCIWVSVCLLPFLIIFWIFINFGLRNYIAYELKICGITIVIACILSIPLFFIPNEDYTTYVIYTVISYAATFIIIPSLISSHYIDIVKEDIKNQSNEMNLSRRAAEWWCKHLDGSNIDEETIEHFKRGLSNYLCYLSKDDFIAITTNSCPLNKVQETWKIPDGLLPKNIVMYVNFKKNEISYIDVSGLEEKIV